MNSWTALCGVLFLALLSMTAHAGLPEPYGRDFARSGGHWPDSAPAPLGAPAKAVNAPLLAAPQLEQRLREFELREGPYADGLAEPLADLARLHRERGGSQEALALYGRALHIVRVNDGLYSERQAPLVRAMLEVYRESGDLEALDQRYDYFFRLYGSGQPPYSELRLRAVEEYLRWQREAYRRSLDSDRRRRLIQAYELNKDLLQQLAGDASTPEQWRRSLTLSQMRNLYLLQESLQPLLQLQSVQRAGVSAFPSSVNDPGRDMETQRLANLARGLPGAGNRLMEDLLDYSQNADSGELAALHLEYGDWLLWNDNRQGANRQYALAEQTLSEAGKQQLLQQLLGQPAEIPANGAFWRQGEEEPPVQLSARLRVDARGQARSVEVEASDPGDEGRANALARRLRATLFRPRFQDGEPRATEDVTRSYDYFP